MRIVALDFGAQRTGVAVCDPTETIVRPLTVVENAASPAGLDKIEHVVSETGADLVVVGMPVSLSGEEHGQARATRRFLRALQGRLTIPVASYDERFTTKVAGVRGGEQPLDARAAAVLLEDFIRSRAGSPGTGRS